ncbi:MAG: hypothetical protein MZV65_13335 [Chromatiales bacterium]|nr:hypothetical protein [Chromatiales bacterium]
MHRPPPDADVAALERGPASGAAAAGVRGAAGAPPEPASCLRARLPDRDDAWPLPRRRDLAGALLGALPFALTGAQRGCWTRSAPTSARAHPMHAPGAGRRRLAARPSWRRWRRCAPSRAATQVAVMAPTELLAEQHCAQLRSTGCEPLGIEVAWLLRASSPAANRAQHAGTDRQRRVHGGGRHACAVPGGRRVRRSLALVIVDEQHRFGVHQRLLLREKGRQQRLRARTS